VASACDDKVIEQKGGMSAYGTQRTFLIASAMSAFGGKADINRAFPCLLLTQSEHHHPC